jgi:hypothetical protein
MSTCVPLQSLAAFRLANLLGIVFQSYGSSRDQVKSNGVESAEVTEDDLLFGCPTVSDAKALVDID